ncbi:hypothetical protein [Leucobacter sp. Psy1]|uniref:hypothetical protein n=1 Tax=Leucobacter sp. Psy1 TaxID=2875729 RepID=UPI001CD1D6EA|nr:hypothetical protein [Leucobacter sp. Psy1]
MVENHTMERRRPKGAVTIAIAAVAILVIGGAIVFGVTQMTGNGNDASPGSGGSATEEPSPTQTDDASGGAGEMEEDVQSSGESDSGSAEAQGTTPLTKQVLDRPMSGQEAIDSLGDDIDLVASRNGKTVEEMKEFLLKNPSAQVSPNGFVSLP